MKRPVHKGINTGTGVYNFCNDKIDGSKFSMNWDDVTCTRCLDKGSRRFDKFKTCPEIEIAKAFHKTYEALAPLYNYKTRKKSAVPWSKVPAKNKRLMVAVVKALLRQGIISEGRFV
jgi:hypothetical protein